MSSHEALERAVALTVTFLRELPEDLRYAAIMASADGQPRRAQALGAAANTARDLELELRHCMPDAKARQTVGATISDTSKFEPYRLAEAGTDEITVTFGGIFLQLPTSTPTKVVHILIAIAQALKLDTDKVWAISDLPGEVRELASDAVHNDEAARATIPIADVCEALGISAKHMYPPECDVEPHPIDRGALLAKLEALREAFDAAATRAFTNANAAAHGIEAVEDGLLRRMAERLAEVDPAWLEGLVKS